jgi:hypothetical protein
MDHGHIFPSSLRAVSIIARANELGESPSASPLATSSRNGRVNRSIVSGPALGRSRSTTVAP